MILGTSIMLIKILVYDNLEHELSMLPKSNWVCKYPSIP